MTNVSKRFKLLLVNLNYEAVRREAQAQGRTYRWIADQCDIDPPTLTRILKGQRPCPGPVYAELVRIFNVHPAVFLGAEDPEAALVDAAHALGITPDRFAELSRARFPEAVA